jgi:hypothetical protein
VGDQRPLGLSREGGAEGGAAGGTTETASDHFQTTIKQHATQFVPFHSASFSGAPEEGGMTPHALGRCDQW